MKLSSNYIINPVAIISFTWFEWVCNATAHCSTWILRFDYCSDYERIQEISVNSNSSNFSIHFEINSVFCMSNFHFTAELLSFAVKIGLVSYEKCQNFLKLILEKIEKSNNLKILRSFNLIKFKYIAMYIRRAAIFKKGSWKRVPNNNQIVFKYYI